MEKKYKGLIKHIKSKEKGMLKENNQLKEILNNQDNSNKLQNLALYKNAIGLDNNNNQLNHTMFNIPVNNNILNDNNNNSMVIDSNNQRNLLNNTLNIANNKRINNVQMMPKIEDPNDDNQKRTLEEFKDLLKRIDEKLDITNNPEQTP